MSEDYSRHKSGRVGMRMAYNWTCEDCGKDSFVRAISANLRDDPIPAQEAGTLEEKLDLIAFSGIGVPNVGR